MLGDRVVNTVRQLIKVTGMLAQIINSAQLHRGYGQLLVTLSRNYQEGWHLEPQPLGFADQLQAALILHEQVYQHQIIVMCLAQALQRNSTGLDHVHDKMRHGFGKVAQDHLDVHSQMLDIKNLSGLVSGWQSQTLLGQVFLQHDTQLLRKCLQIVIAFGHITDCAQAQGLAHQLFVTSASN